MAALPTATPVHVETIMRKIGNLIVASGLIAGASIVPALGADLSVPDYGASAAPAYAPTSVVDNWTGFYIGADVGGLIPDSDDDDSKVIGGLQAGYNQQFGNFVLGAEVGFGLTDAFETSLDGGAALSQDYTITTLAKAGYAIDKAMFYGLAGASFTEFNAQGATTSVDDDTSVGFAFGAGVEYQVMDGVGVKAEYLQSRYLDVGYATAGGAFEDDVVTHAVKLGLNLHF